MDKARKTQKYTVSQKIHSVSNNCTKNYYNRMLTVQVIVEDVVTWIFLRHSVHIIYNLKSKY